MIIGSSNIHTLLDIVSEAVSNELFALVTDESFLSVGEVDYAGFEHNTLAEDAHLAHLITKRLLSENHFIVNDSNRPHVDLWRDDCLLIRDKAFRRQVPISANALRCQLYIFLFSCFAESKVCDLHFSLMKKDILWLEVIMNHLIRQLMQIPNSAHHLPQDQTCLFLGNSFVLF